MKINWIIDIIPDAPAMFCNFIINRTNENELLVSVFSHEWDELPTLRKRAEADIESGNYDHTIKPLKRCVMHE